MCAYNADSICNIFFYGVCLCCSFKMDTLQGKFMHECVKVSKAGRAERDLDERDRGGRGGS